jgi:hypothetical protein
MRVLVTGGAGPGAAPESDHFRRAGLLGQSGSGMLLETLLDLM